MLKIKLIICNCSEHNGAYYYDNVRGFTTENGVCHISMEEKQVIIPLDKIVKIESELME